MKRILALFAVLSLLLCAALPAQAAVYEDITDSAVSTAAAVLKSMGVVDGFEDGLYHGEYSLTRAQLCKLTIYLAGKEGAVAASSKKTLFSDVRGGHWAAGYINLSCSLGYISGYGDGLFGPDDPVTYGQAVTIMLNMLGYGSADIGNFWPVDYVNFAASLGLDEGISLGACDTLTRNDAALLLLNTLCQDTKAGGAFVETVAARTLSSALIMSNSATADDGSAGRALVCAAGSMDCLEQSITLPSELVGERGTLLLDSSGRVRGFLPDGDRTVTVQAASVGAGALTDADGNRYAIKSGAGLIINGEYDTWELGFASLHTGSTAKLFYNSAGAIDLVYVSSGASAGSVYVAQTAVTAASNPFETAFGLKSGGYTIVKNGALSDVSELARYDVGSWDAASNTLIVSDFRLTAPWQDAYPNAECPSRVTLMGHDFTVLESAAESFAAFTPGEEITVLLTADMCVAAVCAPSRLRAPSPLGVLESAGGGKCSVTLTNGLELSGEYVSGASDTGALVGGLVTVTGVSGGLKISGLSAATAPGKWNVAAGTVGEAELSASAVIYERVGGGPVSLIQSSDVLVSSVPAASIDYVGYNSAGRVSVLLLSDVTGNGYTYGIAAAGEQSGGGGGVSITNRTVCVTNGAGESETYTTGKRFTTGSFIGIAGGNGRLTGYVTLQKHTGAARADFTGTDYVSVDGYLIPISEDVQVYNSESESWTTLPLALARAEEFTVYYDKTPETGAMVRIVSF